MMYKIINGLADLLAPRRHSETQRQDIKRTATETDGRTDIYWHSFPSATSQSPAAFERCVGGGGGVENFYI